MHGNQGDGVAFLLAPFLSRPRIPAAFATEPRLLLAKEWCIPIPQKLADEIRSFQRRLGAVGGWIFAAEKESKGPRPPEPHSAMSETSSGESRARIAQTAVIMR